MGHPPPRAADKLPDDDWLSAGSHSLGSGKVCADVSEAVTVSMSCAGETCDSRLWRPGIWTGSRELEVWFANITEWWWEVISTLCPVSGSMRAVVWKIHGPGASRPEPLGEPRACSTKAAKETWRDEKAVDPLTEPRRTGFLP